MNTTCNNDDFEYNYDSKGNLTEVYENHELYCRYCYDKKSRLIREDNTLLNKSILYNYNKKGRLVERIYYPYTLSTLTEPSHTDRFTYAKNKLIAYNDEHIQYDKCGNPIIYRDEKFIWSKQRNLLSIGGFFNFTYNDHNIRISKNTSKETTKYYLCGDNIYAQNSGEFLTFIYEDNELSGFTYRYSDGQTYDFVYKKNIAGDIIGICDTKNNLICKYVYDAFGYHQIFVKYNGQFLDISIIPDGPLSNIASLNPYRFHSIYFDIESGLYYNNGHYYDPEVGNYIN